MSREQFEHNNPKPEGVAFSPECGGYIPEEHTFLTMASHYQAKWIGWQSSENAMRSVGLPAGWTLKKHLGERATIHLYRESDGAWCGAGIEGDGGAEGLRFEFLDALLKAAEAPASPQGLVSVPLNSLKQVEALLSDIVEGYFGTDDCSTADVAGALSIVKGALQTTPQPE